MTDLEPIRQRFILEEPRKRLGHLAADLLRIANFIESGLFDEARPIVRESKFMTEWAARESNLETQELLSETQSFLALKEKQWPNWTRNEIDVLTIASAVRGWSNKFLKLSGLLE